MARRRFCEGCGDVDSSNTPAPGPDGYRCTSCARDHRQRLRNIEHIKTVMEGAGQVLSGKDRAAVADYLEGYIDLATLANRLDTPLVTFPADSTSREAQQ
ncbi:hypothetical protein JOD66_004154 [Nocardioides nitrophenolicus]|nr:hypothetical protein [Nocardioides nitrophenolicus]